MTQTFFSTTIRSLAAVAAAATLSLGTTVAGELDPATADKSQYTIFNPTPRALWRELSPDRPDETESPITVDAGVWVVEASYLDYRRNQGVDTYTVAATTLKVGINYRSDLQIVWDSYAWEDSPGGAKGFGDVELRYKYNLWGNDGGATALALFPFVKIPTGTKFSNGKVEGGLMIPFQMDLVEGIDLGLMAGIDTNYDDIADSYDLSFFHTAVLGFGLTERVGFYTEYIGVTGLGAYQAYFAGGFTLALSENLILDVGTQVGLSNAADELGIFGGFTKRF